MLTIVSCPAQALTAGRMVSMIKTQCYICNAVVPQINGPISDHTYIPQSPGCWKLYTDILSREYGEWKYPPIHRLTVDCYAAQHPTQQPNPKSAQSISVHLLGIYLALEKNMNPKLITKSIGEVVIKNKNQFVWLEPPKNLGSVTVTDVWQAKTLTEHTEIVHKWATSIWKAWKKYHPQIVSLYK